MSQSVNIPTTNVKSGTNSTPSAPLPAGYNYYSASIDVSAWSSTDQLSVYVYVSYDNGATWLSCGGLSNAHGGTQTYKGGTTGPDIRWNAGFPQPGAAGLIRATLTVPSNGQTSGTVTLYP